MKTQSTEEATITKIETDAEGLTTVSLEWGGLNHRTVDDFDIHQLGSVEQRGTDGNAGISGWVILAGNCNLSNGDSIPFVASDDE